MTAALKAGVTYFALVYATGFLLGTVRVLLLLPLVGETAAVLFEAPLMLVVSWIAARWSARRFSVPAKLLPRSVMSAAAFALLMLGEFTVSNVIFGRSLEATLATYRSLPGILGFSAQVIFALLPLAQAFLRPSARNPKRLTA